MLVGASVSTQKKNWGDFQIFVQNMRVIVAPAEAKITPKSQFLAFLHVLLMF